MMTIPINPQTKQPINNARPTRRKRELHPNAKLTQIEVDEIRRLHELEKVTPGVLVEHYGVSKSTINSILRYKTWKMVK